MTDATLPYRGIKVKKPVVKISDDDIDDMLQKLRRQQAVWSQVSRGATSGDQIIAEYSGRIGNKKIVDSGDKPVALFLGTNQVRKKVQQSLIGSRPGDRIHVSIKHRMNNDNVKLAGRRVNYEYHVLDVLEEKIPALDKELARSLGVRNGSLNSLRKQVRNILHHQIDNLVRRNLREQLIDGLLDVYQATPSDDMNKKDIKAFRKQRIPSAKKRTTDKHVESGSTRAQSDRQQVLSRIIRKIIRENSITVDQAKVAAAIDAIAARSDNPEETGNRYHNNQELFSKVEASVLENQVLEFVLAHATVRETPVSYGKLCRELDGSGLAEANTVSQQSTVLPIIELTSDKKCEFCARNCCTYITQKIPSPRTKEDFSHLLWQISHQQVEAYKDTDGWYLMFRSRCEHLLANGRCGNYEQRMQICRKYSNDYCEFDAPAADSFKLNFKDYNSLLAYCKKRFPRWEY
jgi:trigger factor